MDIKCRICGEPWEQDCLHDEVADRYPDKPWYTKEEPEIADIYTRFSKEESGWYNQSIYEKFYKEVKDDFFSRGCKALYSYGGACNKETVDRETNSIYAMIADIMGDDIDAIAAATEDYDYMRDNNS